MSEFDDYMRNKAEAAALVKRKQETADFEHQYLNKIGEQKAEADQRARMNAIRDEVAHKAVLEAMKIEEEIVNWIEEQTRETLEKLIREDSATWYVGNGKPNMNIATHISEYLEFLDRCDEEKQAQENQRQSNPTWGIFG